MKYEYIVNYNLRNLTLKYDRIIIFMIKCVNNATLGCEKFKVQLIEYTVCILYHIPAGQPAN